jgi:hypothetical protein
MREMTESDYEARFHQLTYTMKGDLETLEGRFAPKENPEKKLQTSATNYCWILTMLS